MAAVRALLAFGRGQGLVTSSYRPALRTSDIAPATRQVVEGMPEKHLRRKVRIFFQCANAMQSGTSNRHWRVEFDDSLKETRWDNPLMGWASSRDPMGRLRLEFDSVDDAVAYATKLGFDYTVSGENLHEQEVGEDFSKEKEIPELFYDDNFLYNPPPQKFDKVFD